MEDPDRLRATVRNEIEAASAFGKMTTGALSALRYRLEQMYPRSMKWGFEAADSSYPLGVESLDLTGLWNEDERSMPQAASFLHIVETEDDLNMKDSGLAPPSSIEDEVMANILATSFV